MESVVIIVLGITVTTLGCVWMGISYAKKSSGLEKGASQREVEALQQQVNHIQEEMVPLQEEVKRLIRIAKGAEE